VQHSAGNGTNEAGAGRERVAALSARLRNLLGAEQLVTDPLELATYECDGLTVYRATPALAVLARDEADVVTTVRECAAAGVPFVARGAGTGLSGGAVPREDGVLVVTSRLRSITELDVADRRAVVEPGVANLEVTRAAAPQGWYYAPDPSSQQVCSIGGNVAENSGGAHCLKHGFTTNHVTGLRLVTPEGDVVELGGKAADPPGYDLIGAIVGSEGTLGVVTQATLRLSRLPESVQTLLAAFAELDAAGSAVSAIIAAGLVPAAIEIMDALAIEAAEAAVACNYPAGAGAVLVVELDGPAVDVADGLDEVRALCEASGAVEIRLAADAAERARIWVGRKSAFAAVGRISPDYIVQDGVVPRSELGAVLRDIAELAARSGVRVANVFHAGDGNLHPLVLFDASVPGQLDRAEAVSGEILELCLQRGGSLTGEHGIGLDKLSSMPKMFTEDDLETMRALRRAFDPAGLCNPGKAIPAPRLCGEAPGPRQGVHPLVEAGLAEQF
jgi:glycolate oxidase